MKKFITALALFVGAMPLAIAGYDAMDKPSLSQPEGKSAAHNDGSRCASAKSHAMSWADLQVYFKAHQSVTDGLIE